MIIHVFNSSIVSGPETLVIPALPLLGEEVVVIFLSEIRCGDKSDLPPAYSRSFGLKTIEISVKSRWDQAAVSELKALLGELSPRIVHAHEVKASAYVAAARSRGRNYKLVTTNHGVRAKKAPRLRLYEWIFTHLVMPKFDRVLCVCSSDKELLLKRGVPKEKIHVHLNGVDRQTEDLSQRTERSAEIRNLWGLKERGVSSDAICLGIVGRLSPEKRHSFVLHTMRKLQQRAPKNNIHLIVFGTGALSDKLVSEANALEISSSVQWMGYRATVGSEMRGFDLLLSVSSAEGLPINIIEAGWAGVSVLATAVDGNLDLIPSPEFGTLVNLGTSETELAEKLEQILSSEKIRRETGANLQKRVIDGFSGKVWLERLKELYRF
jgi:glycosyltransferase involved in cell wall biosynthesis